MSYGEEERNIERKIRVLRLDKGKKEIRVRIQTTKKESNRG